MSAVELRAGNSERDAHTCLAYDGHGTGQGGPFSVLSWRLSGDRLILMLRSHGPRSVPMFTRWRLRPHGSGVALEEIYSDDATPIACRARGATLRLVLEAPDGWYHREQL